MAIKTYDDLTAAVDRQLKRWAEVIGGKPWGAARGKPRIYMPTRKDITAYFAFDDFPTGDEHELLGGAALRVYVDDCGQHKNWYISQRKDVMQRMRSAALALQSLQVGDDRLAADIIAADADIDDDVLDAASRAFNNDRANEIRKLMGL